MKGTQNLQRARHYLNSHIDPSKRLKSGGPCITLSRQTGIGAENICEYLVKKLEENAAEGFYEWTYFDKNLIDYVIQDHELPENVDKYLDESTLLSVENMFSEMLSLHPSKIELLNKTAKTILRLTNMGNCIIVGRGANIITQNHRKAFHIRLVAPAEDRTKKAVELYGRTAKEQTAFIEKEDKARKNFIKKYFHKDISDPLLYHLIFNVRLLKAEEIAETIALCVMSKYPEYFKKQ